MEETFIQSIRNHKVEAEDYIGIVNQLTKEQTDNLDNLIQEITSLTRKKDYEIEIGVLQEYYLKLSSELYIMVDKLKQFEIYSSLAKANESEEYNNAYLKESTVDTGNKKPAVAELQIRASNSSKKASLVNTVYASAFKTVKSKVEAGNMVADTLKNIIKARTSLEFTTNQSNNNRSSF